METIDRLRKIEENFRKVGLDGEAATTQATIKALEALDRLVNAKALAGVRELVAGWNGENRPDGPYAERHPSRLGATLPKTDCGAVYELDEAMQAARAALAKASDGGA